MRGSTSKPPQLTFRSFIKNNVFPFEWRQTNVVPVHNKGDKQHRKITDEFLCYLFVEKSWNGSYNKTYYFLMKAIYSHQINQDLNKKTRLLIN